MAGSIREEVPLLTVIMIMAELATLTHRSPLVALLQIDITVVSDRNYRYY